MAPLFEELDHRQTPMGELVLRRRRLLSLGGRTVYEIKLGDAYLMSSLFHAAEDALAREAFGLLGGEKWDVAVGGLGLGYTAAAALEFAPVRRLVVVEALAPVIDWHKKNLLPVSGMLTGDPRCIFHHADFFELVRTRGLDPEVAGRRFDAILLDIDHCPASLLDAGHGEFYTPAGMQRLLSCLKPGGVFALWSNDVPDDGFVRMLAGVFARAEGRVIEFENPLQESVSANGIYIAVA